jgi:cytochrome c biogenesis protein CcdA
MLGNKPRIKRGVTKFLLKLVASQFGIMPKAKKIPQKAVLISFIILSCFFLRPVFCQDAPEKPQSPDSVKKIFFFFTPSCHICHEVRESFMPGIEKKYADKLAVEYKDLGDMDFYKFLLGLRKQYNFSADIKTPTIFFNKKFYVGRDQITSELIRDIEQSEFGAVATVTIEPAAADIKEVFFAFTPIAVMGAGLIDGINPCAFTVIVFFISYLAFQGYSRRQLIIIGFSFIFAVFLTYLLIGLGLFKLFYSLKGFWLMRKTLNFGIGGFTVILGGMAVWDAFKFKGTGSTEGMVLQLPQAVKNQIHRVIGGQFRKTGGNIGPDNSNQAVWKLVVGAFITGFLVSWLEAVCTGQVYLPTIVMVLKSTNIKLRAFLYLLLYNFMFIVPLVGIFILALFGVSSSEFSRFLKKHFLLTKILMAVLFFGLGIYLMWKG